MTTTFLRKKYREENQEHGILEKSLHFWVEETISSLFGSFEFFQDHEEIFDTVQLLSESVSKVFSAANTVSFWDLYLDVFHFAFACLPHSFLSASFSACLCACLCLWKWQSSRDHAHLPVSSSDVWLLVKESTSGVISPDCVYLKCPCFWKRKSLRYHAYLTVLTSDGCLCLWKSQLQVPCSPDCVDLR